MGKKKQFTGEHAQLEANKQKVLTELYGRSAYADLERKVRDLRHKALEKRYNELEKQSHVLQGKPAEEYRYRRDVRHEFSFRSEARQTRRGTYRVEVAEGPLHHPDTVINWRHSDIGAKKDQQCRTWARRRYRAATGDDVGHRISVAAGVDPAERRNVGMQNFIQNQGGGTYHAYEQAQRSWLQANPGQRLGICVQEAYTEDRHGQNRSRGRKVTLENDQGRAVFRDNLIHANSPAAQGRVRPESPKQQPPARGSITRSAGKRTR
jgi:hypothetical protein